MPIIDGIETILANYDNSKKISKLAKREVFGLSCDGDWSEVLCKYLIIDMFNCSGTDGLDQCDIDCLEGKLTAGLKNNCC